jgi:hypothetical protein
MRQSVMHVSCVTEGMNDECNIFMMRCDDGCDVSIMCDGM